MKTSLYTKWKISVTPCSWRRRLNFNLGEKKEFVWVQNFCDFSTFIRILSDFLYEASVPTSAKSSIQSTSLRVNAFPVKIINRGFWCEPLAKCSVFLYPKFWRFCSSGQSHFGTSLLRILCNLTKESLMICKMFQGHYEIQV